jgi:UDP-N-acetylglucosamine diphosphorylase/glucosamine-1-phosphate N-acetyltransferase
MDINGIVLVEQDTEDFFPFSILHPQWELRTGLFQQWERIQQQFPSIPLFFSGREAQTKLFFQKNPTLSVHSTLSGTFLFLDARFIPSIQFAEDILSITNEQSDNLITLQEKDSQRTIGFIQHYESPTELPSHTDIQFTPTIQQINITGVVYRYIWDAIYANSEVIVRDSMTLSPSTITPQYLWQFGVFSYADGKPIHLGENAQLHATVVLDSRNGPIIIGNNVTIMAHTVIFGPAVIGDNTIINSNSSITGGSTIGPNCRVRGEISISIFQSFANKAHDGFLGHSFVSEFANLGAGTITSNLKNTYGNITLEFPNKRNIATGKQFIGSLIGDHSKTAIGTTLNSGTVIGVLSTIATAGFPPKFIDNFSWIQADIRENVILSKALSVMEHVKSRRNQPMIDTEIEILTSLYNNQITR